MAKPIKVNPPAPVEVLPEAAEVVPTVTIRADEPGSVMALLAMYDTMPQRRRELETAMRQFEFYEEKHR